MKKLFTEFKQFISKGNIIDLAIAVVLGNAFNKIVSTLVNSVVMPLIGLATGGASLENWKWVITPASEGVAENAVLFGSFLQAIIDFLIIALCLFLAMKVVKFSRSKIEYTTTLLKKEIKELSKKDKKRLKKQGINVDAIGEGKTGTVEEAVKKEEIKMEVKAEPEPTKEEILLTQIRDLLASKNVSSPDTLEQAKPTVENK